MVLIVLGVLLIAAGALVWVRRRRAVRRAEEERIARAEADYLRRQRDRAALLGDPGGLARSNAMRAAPNPTPNMRAAQAKNRPYGDATQAGPDTSGIDPMPSYIAAGLLSSGDGCSPSSSSSTSSDSSSCSSSDGGSSGGGE